MKNIKKWLSLALVTVCVAAFAACAKDEEAGSDGPVAEGSTIVSGAPNNAGGSGSGSGDVTPDDDVDDIEGTYIIYDLGDCSVATLPSNRQEVTDGQAYTLYTPEVPVLSNYEFVGWKNVITGEKFPQSGTFSGENNVYLEAVWVVYGPAV